VDLFEHAEALARAGDPETSREAASLADATKGEKVVFNTLLFRGPLTMEEVGEIHGKPSDHLGPRFASLRRKNMVVVVEDENGDPVTRPGRSGRRRLVFDAQTDKTKWVKPGGVKSKVSQLREEIARLRRILEDDGIDYAKG